ncbi:MAG: hypothetical protein R3288_01255 [Woeseiaceae bacterium]|nr:hypothetical protein [Woeseiaceae bacterium]
MNRIIIAVTAALLGVVCNPAAADEHESAATFSPVEAFTCNYNDDMGPDDLDEVIEDWNEFLDDEGVTTYWASTLVPYYYGAESFDFGWLGAWQTGAAMGEGTDMWLAKGREFERRFDEVATCDTHVNFAATMIKKPASEASPDNFVLLFSDCNVHDGVDFGNVMEATGAWAAYQAEAGYENGTWMMFAAFGGGDAEYDFKLVDAFDNFAAVGRMYDLYGNGRGFEKHGELVGELYECDESRVYLATVRRRMPEE